MKTEVMYRYLGTNGIIDSPGHLEDIYYTRRLHLIADEGKKLTRDGTTLVSSAFIAEEELLLWREFNGIILKVK